MESRDLDVLIDRLVAEYADRVASGRIGELDDLLVQVPDERRVELRRLLELVEVGEGGSGAPLQVPKPLGTGVELGNCRILGELGRGGMATVYRAEQKALRRIVALKVLRPGLALDPKHAERFRREGLAIARLEHPNVVRVHDVGAEGGHLFLVMEQVDGGNLAQALAKLPKPGQRDGAAFRRAIGLAEGEAVASGNGVESYEVEVARFFATVARAVAAAHARGVIHRDLKPSNILLKRDGTPVVADFGLATGDGDLSFTLTGEPLGTPYYMSPEQVEQARHRVDGRTDVWSLGVTLYEALAGRRPFEGPTTIAVFDAIRRELPPSLRAINPRLSRAVAAIVSKAMAHDPKDRYASAEALAADLNALATGRKVGAASFLGRLRRGHVAIGHFGQSFEYRSGATLFGLPLLHINVGGRGWGGWGGQHGAPRTSKTARGIVAIGDVAVGVIAVGGIALGGLAMGGLAVGLLGFGGMAVAGLAFAGVAVGGIAIGGCALGVVAIGGFAAGWLGLGSSGWSHVTRDEAILYYDQHLRATFEGGREGVRRLVERILWR